MISFLIPLRIYSIYTMLVVW